MMEELDTLEIDGNEYCLIDSIVNNEKVFHYFSNVNDSTDIYILKDEHVDDKDYFVSLDTETEFNYALSLFFNKHKDDSVSS